VKSEAERLTLLKNLLGDTTKYANNKFESNNNALLDSYNQQPYGTEEEGRSQVVSSDHYDMVESDMPSLARIFLGANKVLEFKAFGAHDAEEARQKTEYADYLIRQQRNSFKILCDFIKEPGFAKCSAIKFFCEEKEQSEYVYYKGLSEDETTLVLSDLEAGDNVSQVAIDSKSEQGAGIYDIKFRVTRAVKRIALVGVPANSLIITRGATDKELAPLVGDECIKRKYELIQDGFDAALVRSLMPTQSGHRDLSRRFAEQGGWDSKSGYHWHFDEVVVQNLYALMDSDEDGIPERRYIMKCGEKIIKDEPYGIVPYAICSQVPIPHALIGKSRGEQAARYQKEKTALKRGILDNIYSVNRTGFAVDGSSGRMGGSAVDIDELLTERIKRVVRTDGNPYEKIMPLTMDYIGDRALQVVQYVDQEKAGSLGAQLNNQGLASDKFYKETATRFEGVAEAGQAKIELVARVYAETGWRDLYEGVIWTAQHYQDSETEIMVLGKPLIVDPRKWKYEHYAQSCVGLGSGDSADAIESLSSMFQTQMHLKQVGSTLVDDAKIYTTMSDIIRALGKPDVSRYFNDPAIPEAMLMPMLEQMAAKVEALQQQAQQNPLAEAELVRAQARMVEVQGKETNSMRQFMLKMAQQDEQFRAKMSLELAKLEKSGDEFIKSLARDLTDLELEYKKNVPGSYV